MDWTCSGCGRHFSFIVSECPHCIGIKTTVTTGGTQPKNIQTEIAALIKNLDFAKSYGCVDVSISVVISRLQQLLAGDTQLTDLPWVECTDKLPEIGNDVLIALENRIVLAQLGKCDDGIMWYYGGDGASLNEIHYWMSLPTLPNRGR